MIDLEQQRADASGPRRPRRRGRPRRTPSGGLRRSDQDRQVRHGRRLQVRVLGHRERPPRGHRLRRRRGSVVALASPDRHPDRARAGCWTGRRKALPAAVHRLRKDGTTEEMRVEVSQIDKKSLPTPTSRFRPATSRIDLEKMFKVLGMPGGFPMPRIRRPHHGRWSPGAELQLARSLSAFLRARPRAPRRPSPRATSARASCTSALSGFSWQGPRASRRPLRRAASPGGVASSMRGSPPRSPRAPPSRRGAGRARAVQDEPATMPKTKPPTWAQCAVPSLGKMTAQSASNAAQIGSTA